MSVYVFSTLTAGNIYPVWRRVEGRDLPIRGSHVEIHGGANLPTKTLVTPKGVMTTLTDAQYAEVKENKSFQKHVAGGFITVEKKPYSPDEIAAEMTEKDASAPLVEKDFEDRGEKPPSTGKAQSDEPFDMASVRSNQRPGEPAETKVKGEKGEEKSTDRKRRGRGRSRKDEASE